MAFLVSPGVQVVEKDLTNIIPAVATSTGGTVGQFEWGPANQPTLVTSEQNLIRQFGYPKADNLFNNRVDWYAAANFLDYSKNLQLVRILADSDRNSASEPKTTTTPSTYTFTITAATATAGDVAVAYNGTSTVTVTVAAGDTVTALRTKLVAALTAVSGVTATNGTGTGAVNVSIAGTATQPANTTGQGVTFTVSSFVAGTSTTSSTASIANVNEFEVEKSTLVDGSVYARYPGRLGNGIGFVMIDASITDSDFNNQTLFGPTTASTLINKANQIWDTRPSTSPWAKTVLSADSDFGDEIHVVVFTTDTNITGNAFEILETYSYLSKVKNGKTMDGAPNFYVDVINTSSNYIYILTQDKSTTGLGTATGRSAPFVNMNSVNPSPLQTFAPYGNLPGKTTTTPGVVSYLLSAGVNGTAADKNYITAWNQLNDVEAIDVNLMFAGDANAPISGSSKVVEKAMIKVVEDRKDAVAFVSPDYASAVASSKKITDVNNFFNSTTNSAAGFNSSSYVMFDSGWKRQYDRYNDEYFWMPLNPDIAGVSARTDYTNDAWWSPAGLNRGQIKNVVKLSWSPTTPERDILYVNRINPVVSFRGQGTLLYGDKTALSRPSAFDRVNVRRLFIILEKAIATGARYQLFEFNDEITRRTFVNSVEPFLADIKSRRGITDYKVVCDESNNTPEILDQNRFVADIYVKPTRSINYITLSFVAVRSGVSFSEVTGA